MAGTLTTSVIQSDTSSPPTFKNNSVEVGTLCRAWVNFNGTGTVAIRASFNVSSITDNSTGNYTINFTNALPDANYATVALQHDAVGTGGQINGTTGQTTTALQITTANYTGAAYQDKPGVHVAVFR